MAFKCYFTESGFNTSVIVTDVFNWNNWVVLYKNRNKPYAECGF